MEIKDEIQLRFQENLSRIRSLVEAYKSRPGGGRRSVRQTDLLRGAVVLLHASFEDSLRSLCEWKMPAASPEAFSEVPLVETRGKTRFGLPELAAFRGKAVDEVIEQSVREFLDKSSFNHPGDVKAVLVTIGVAPDTINRDASALAAMMTRRHWVAHRADRNPTKGRGHHPVRSLASSTIVRWVNTIERLGSAILSKV